MALPLKTLAGQTPTPLDYKVAAQGLSYWLNSTFETGKLGFAGGGEVNSAKFLGGEDMTDVIAKSLEDSVSNQLNDAIDDLMKQLMLKPREVEKKDITQPSPDEDLGTATEIVGGARLLIAAGFPPLAAAVLSSVIQAESAWRGQRTPWVLNDGAGTNKGLISWNRSRITNAERFLGKPLETASNAEQVKWIKEELKQYGLLDEMLNPQATEDQLKEAVYKYVRWDRRYDADHWANISKVRAALERGEQGSYIAGRYNIRGGNFNIVEYITGDRNHPNFDLEDHGTRSNYHDHIAFATIADKERAKSALIAAGIKIGSELRPGDPGYHGKNLAIDVPGYQWGGKGEIGQKEYSGSARVRSALGLFGGGSTGKGGLTMTHPGEYIIDKDSVNAFGIDFFDIVNQVENMSQRQQAAKQLMGILQLYAGYEAGGRQKIKVKVPAPQVVTVPMPVPVGGASVMASNSSGLAPQDINYRG